MQAYRMHQMSPTKCILFSAWLGKNTNDCVGLNLHHESLRKNVFVTFMCILLYHQMNVKKETTEYCPTNHLS